MCQMRKCQFLCNTTPDECSRLRSAAAQKLDNCNTQCGVLNMTVTRKKRLQVKLCALKFTYSKLVRGANAMTIHVVCRALSFHFM